KLPALLPAGFKYKLLIVLASPEGKFDVQAGARPAYYAYARTRTVDGAAPDTTESFDITDADGDGVLWGAGDSGVVDFKQKTPKYKVELGGEPKRFADNKLLHYGLEATWRKNDSLVTTSFTFAPSQAVPSAQLSINGALDLSAALANGHSARAIGTFLDKIIE